MLYTIGNLNQDVGKNQIVELDDNISAKICMIWATYGADKDDKHDSPTELYTHTNIAVVGSQETVFHTDMTAEVRALSDEVEELESVHIVDADMSYDYPNNLKNVHP